MNLTKTIPDGEMQIHTTIREEFRNKESTSEKGEEMIGAWEFCRENR